MSSRGLVRRAALVTACGLVAGGGLVGCGNTATNTINEVVMDGPPEGLKIGAMTTVAVRPDVLGAARDLPVPLGTDSINGATVSVTGSLHKVQADWIVLDDVATGHRHWISLETVSWIRQAKPRAAAPAGGGVTPVP
jgi:hypothetical protein